MITYRVDKVNDKRRECDRRLLELHKTLCRFTQARPRQPKPIKALKPFETLPNGSPEARRIQSLRPLLNVPNGVRIVNMPGTIGTLLRRSLRTGTVIVKIATPIGHIEELVCNALLVAPNHAGSAC